MLTHNSVNLSLRQTGHVSCYTMPAEAGQPAYVAYSSLGTSLYIDLDVCRILLPFMRDAIEADDKSRAVTAGPFVPEAALDEVGRELQAELVRLDSEAA